MGSSRRGGNASPFRGGNAWAPSPAVQVPAGGVGGGGVATRRCNSPLLQMYVTQSATECLCSSASSACSSVKPMSVSSRSFPGSTIIMSGRPAVPNCTPVSMRHTRVKPEPRTPRQHDNSVQRTSATPRHRHHLVIVGTPRTDHAITRTRPVNAAPAPNIGGPCGTPTAPFHTTRAGACARSRVHSGTPPASPPLHVQEVVFVLVRIPRGCDGVAHTTESTSPQDVGHLAWIKTSASECGIQRRRLHGARTTDRARRRLRRSASAWWRWWWHGVRLLCPHGRWPVCCRCCCRAGRGRRSVSLALVLQERVAVPGVVVAAIGVPTNLQSFREARKQLSAKS